MLKRLRALSVQVIIRYTVLIFLFIGLSVYLLINYEQFPGRLADTLGIAGAIMAFGFSFVNFLDEHYEKKRLSELVSIRFRNIATNEEYVLPFGLRRGDFTRSELFGYIGAIPTRIPGKRFVLPWLSTKAFFNALENVQTGNDDRITIHCTQADFDQFDFTAAAALDAADPSALTASAATNTASTAAASTDTASTQQPA